jgi:hypothetical protein
MACWGRCHAPIKSRRTSPTGDKRHNKRSQANRPTASKRVSSPPVGTFSSASDVTDHRIETASLEATAPLRMAALRIALSLIVEAVA